MGALPAYDPVVVGTIEFGIGATLGTIEWLLDINFVAGDLLQIQTRTQGGTPDSNLEDLSITIVGCAPTEQCAV